MKEQYVLVCRTSLLEELGSFQGYTLDAQRYLDAIFSDEDTHFHERTTAERDVRYKQIIPYVVLRCRDQIFTYVRGKATSDERLRLRTSIGLGGHIEPVDASSSNLSVAYRMAARREVLEEVCVSGPYHERVVGLINDDSDYVGRVHLGIFHIGYVANVQVRSREDRITAGRFELLESLVRRSLNGELELESWSRISLSALLDPHMPVSHSSE